MSRAKRLIREIHRRSLWQVLSIYLTGSWIAVQVVQTLADSAGLPNWVPAMAVALLVIGFPIVMATAFIQEGLGHDHGHRDKAVESEPMEVGPTTTGKLFTWRNAMAGGVAAFALWGVVATFLLLAGPGTSGSMAEGEADRPVIAVLPFTSGGAEEDSKTLSLGLHDDLLTRLSKIKALRVISRTSMMQYQETTKDIRAIGQELGAAAILEGSVVAAGDQVRVNAQLIDASTDEHLWADNYQMAYTLKNIFDLQREIAERIADALSATLLPDEKTELAGVPTEDMDAYNFFLRGNSYFAAGPRSDDFTVAFQMYEQAIELDPDFTEAYVRLALARSEHCQNRSTCFRPENRTAILEAASKGLSLAPDLPQAMVAMGYYHYAVERDFEKALDYGLRAEEDGLGDAEVHHLLGAVKRRMDDFEGSIESFAEAARLDPLSGHFLEDLGHTSIYARRFQEAEDVLRRSIALAPNERTAYGYLGDLYMSVDGNDTRRARNAVLEYPDTSVGTVQGGLWWADLVDGDFDVALARPYTQRNTYRRAVTLELSGRLDEARVVWDSMATGLASLVEEEPNRVGARLTLGRAYTALGRAEDAAQQAEAAMAAMPFTRDAVAAIGVHYQAAEIFALAGEPERAVELLQLLLDRNTGATTAELAAHPVFASLRNHPGFQELIER